MKQLLLLLLFAGAFQSIAHAQVSVGLRAGTLFSSYWKTTEEDSGNRLLHRLQIGAVAELPLNERFSLRAELNYAAKGDAWYFDYASGHREEIKDVYHYLEVPILAKYTFVTGSSLNVYALGGPYLAHAQANKYTEDGEEYKVKYAKGDFGLWLGGGASFPVGPGKLIAELRFSRGFKNIDAFRDEDTPTRLNSFGLSVGWMTNL